MQTTISLPNRLFRAAEQYARRTQKTRSELYADALAEYLARHTPDAVTNTMDRVLDRLGAGPNAEPDPFTAAAARQALERAEW